MTQAREENVGRQLMEAGWAPGAIFHLPGLKYSLNSAHRDGDAWVITEVGDRTVKSKERLVVISHPCDIVLQNEKYIEALICANKKPDDPMLAKWQRNSPRYFVVNPDIAYVANAFHRIKIEKASLLNVPLEYAAPNKRKQQDFMLWLARRYDRIVVEDDVHDCVIAKVAKFFDSAENEIQEWYDLFNRAVKEIRLAIPMESMPPYTTWFLYLLYPGGRLSEESLNAIYRVHRELVSMLEPNAVLAPDPIISDEDEIQYRYIRETEPLYLDYVSALDEE